MERKNIFLAGFLSIAILAFGFGLFAQVAKLNKFPAAAHAAVPHAKNDRNGPGADTAMDFEQNGYSLEQFKDFQKKWHFVTTRYRKDTGEMRLTYANDLAWNALLAGSTDYPDGAVFAKIGFVTEEDPSFTSSVVPSASRRYQLMVRNKKKHAATGGWGFAIFGKFGEVMTKDRGTNGELCIACHNMVPEKGYVFSVPMQEAVEKTADRPTSATIITPASLNETAAQAKPVFETEKATDLPPDVLDLIPETFTEVRRLKKTSLETKAQGGIGEMRPFLIREAVKSQLPAVLVNADRKEIFALAYQRVVETDCMTPDGKKGVVVVTHFNGGEKETSTGKIRTRSGKLLSVSTIWTNEFCQAK